MKKVVLFSAFMAIASTAMAEDYEPVKTCTSISRGAESTMTARQRGVSAQEMFEMAKEDDGKINPVIQKMIVGAYEQPRYTTEEYRQRAAKEYGNAWFVKCMRVYQRSVR